MLVPFGDDLRFVNANKMYSNFDRVVSAVRHNRSFAFELAYGTIGGYADAVQSSAAVFPTRDDADLLPYRKFLPWGFYTGYYTTRPLLKGAIRQSDELLRASETARVVGPRDSPLCALADGVILAARRVSAIMTVWRVGCKCAFRVDDTRSITMLSPARPAMPPLTITFA